jgi:hypothetical protein
MDYNAKCEERRRRSMREVLEAVCRLRDRLMEMSSQTPSGGPAANGWSWQRLRDEVRHTWDLRRRLLDDAPEGVFTEADEEEIPF